MGLGGIMKKKYINFFLMVLAIMSLVCIYAVPLTLTLDQAVVTSMKHKPNLKAFAHQVQASRMDERLAWTDYYPKVNISLQTAVLATDQNRSLSRPIAELAAQQLIYSFAGPQEKAKVAGMQTHIVKLQEAIARNDTQFAVEQTFLDGWRLQQQQAVLQKLLASSTAVTQQHSHEYLVSLRNKSAWYTSTAEHATNLARIHAFDEQMRIAASQLSFLLGYNTCISLKSEDGQPQTKLVWDQPKRVTLHPLKEYLAWAKEYRPEIKNQRKIIDLHEQEAHIAARTRLPTISVGALVSHTFVDKCRHFHRHSGNDHAVNAAVSWPIFDGLVSDYEREKAQALKMEAVLLMEEIENQVRSQVESSYYILKQSLHDLNAEHFRYAKARNEFEVRDVEFSHELITKASYLQAVTTWQDAQFSWVNKKTEVAINMQKLFYRCGYPQKNRIY